MSKTREEITIEELYRKHYPEYRIISIEVFKDFVYVVRRKLERGYKSRIKEMIYYNREMINKISLL